MKLGIYFLLCMTWALSGQTVLSQSDYVSSIPDSLNKVIKSIPDDQKLDSLAFWSWQFREKDADLAIALGQKGISLSEKMNNAHKRAQISNFLGAIYLHYKFDYTSALPYLHRAYKLASSIGDSVQIGYAHNNLGDAYYLANNTVLALEHAFKSLEVFTLLKDTTGICYSFVNLGLAQKSLGHIDLAKDYFIKSIRYGELVNNYNTIAYSKLEIGRILLEQDSLNQAQQYFIDSYRLHEEMGNIIYAGYSLTGIGDLLFKQGQLQDAFDHYVSGIKKFAIRNHQLGIAQNKLHLAIIYSLWDEKEKGKQELHDAIEICEKLKLPKELLNAYQKQAEFYTNLGEEQEAIKQFGFFLNEANKLFNDLQFKVLEETEKVIQNDVDLSMAKQKMRTKNIIQASLILILVLVMVVAILIVWKYKSSRQNNMRLMESNLTKDKLFSIISHDLRKPLVSLIQSIELLNDNHLDESKRSQLIKSLNKQTENTYALLENLLSLSASKTGKLPFNPQQVSIQDIVDEQWQLLKPEVTKKRIQLNTTLHQSTVYADIEMIRMVIRNILSNSIKYSDVGQSITIVSKKSDHQVIIKIIDHGIGMDQETLDMLFKSELVTSTQGTAGEKGTGIGLSLCQELVDKHGGEIRVSSEPGIGSEFSLFFPKK